MVVPRMITVAVATAGVRVPLIASGVPTGTVVAATVQATTGSTIYIGDSTVSAANGIQVTALAAPVNLPMQAGQDAIDLRQIYIDASTSGAKLSVLYFEKTS